MLESRREFAQTKTVVPLPTTKSPVLYFNKAIANLETNAIFAMKLKTCRKKKIGKRTGIQGKRKRKKNLKNRTQGRTRSLNPRPD